MSTFAISLGTVIALLGALIKSLSEEMKKRRSAVLQMCGRTY